MKFWERNDLEDFSVAKIEFFVEEKNKSKSNHIHMQIGFHGVAKHIEWWLEINTFSG